MISVSENFKTNCESNDRTIKTRATFNGTTIVEGSGDLVSIEVNEAVNGDSLSMGETCSSKLVLKMKAGTSVALTNGYVIPEVAVNDEYVKLGKFYITEVEGNKVKTITAYDGMSQLEQDYNGTINNATIQSVAQGIATQCGVTLASGITWPSYTITTDKVYKCRELIGYIAGLMGKNARFDRDGKLNFVWYSSSGINISPEVQYMNGIEKETEDSITLNSITSGTEDNVLTAGSGRGIKFTNPFMTQAILNSIYDSVGSITYQPCKVKYRGNPSVQAGDIISVTDVDENSMSVNIMSQDIKITGGMSVTVYSYGQTDTDYVMSESPTEAKLRKIYTGLTEALREATEKLLGSDTEGYYEITVNNDGFPTGWTIRDTPAITSTTKMWICNKNGIGFSNDGGGTIDRIALTSDGYIVGTSIQAGSISVNNVTTTFGKDLDISSNNSLEELSTRMTTAETSISNNEEAINLRATTETVDSLGERVTAAESAIEVNAEGISSKVAKDGIISAINQSPEEIKIAASKISIELGTSTEIGGADNSKGSMTIYDGNNDVIGKIDNKGIELNAPAITVPKASTTLLCDTAYADYLPTDNVAEKASMAQVRIDKVNQEVITKVSNSEFESYRSQTASEISQKVAKGSIISEINQSAETVKITANKIQLVGYSEVDGNAYISGNVTATSGNIGGWGISGSALSASSSNFEVLFHCPVSLGHSGVNLDNVIMFVYDKSTSEVQYPYQLYSDGTVIVKRGEVGGCSISDGILQIKNANIAERLSVDKLDANIINTNNFNSKTLSTGKLTVATGCIIGNPNSYTNHIELVSSNVYCWTSGGTRYSGLWHDIVRAGISWSNNQSDSRVKNSIELLTDKYSMLFDGLIPRRYKYNDGDSGRYHTGFVAQEVKQAMDNAGVEASEFACYCIDDAGTDNEIMWLRRDEIVALCVKEIQSLKARVAELEAGNGEAGINTD